MSTSQSHSTVTGAANPRQDGMRSAVDDEMAAKVRDAVLRQIESGTLALPSLPRVAASCLVHLSRPDYSFRAIASTIETDPLVAARLVKLANSAAWAGLSRLTSIHECVTRIGANELRGFLLETAARQLFESKDGRIGALGKLLWDHSVAVALLARLIVKKAQPALADHAYLAGLLHDVGKPVVAAMLLESERRLVGTRTQSWILPTSWIRLIDQSHRPIGLALCSKWGLPPTVAHAIREAGHYDSSDAISIVNAVQLGNALAKREGICAAAPDAGEIEAMVFVGRELFGFDEAALDAMAQQVREQLPSKAM